MLIRCFINWANRDAVWMYTIYVKHDCSFLKKRRKNIQNISKNIKHYNFPMQPSWEILSNTWIKKTLQMSTSKETSARWYELGKHRFKWKTSIYTLYLLLKLKLKLTCACMWSRNALDALRSILTWITSHLLQRSPWISNLFRWFSDLLLWSTKNWTILTKSDRS